MWGCASHGLITPALQLGVGRELPFERREPPVPCSQGRFRREQRRSQQMGVDIADAAPHRPAALD